MRKTLLFLLVGLSTLWLAYVTYDVYNNQNNLEPETLFNAKDEELLIVLRPSELVSADHSEFKTGVNYELLSQLNPEQFSMAYLSIARSHCLIIQDKGWTKKRISELFGKQSDIKFKGNSFKWGEFHGDFNKTKLYLYKEKYDRENKLSNLIYDKKATALLCSIDKNHFVTSRTEIYVKSDGLITYIVKQDNSIIGSKVNDSKIFAKYIPSNIDFYHFKEKDFWNSKDPVFANGPMFLWLENGFVELTINGEKALISDFMEGQDPDLVLSDFTQQFDTSRYSVPLTSTFPSKGKSFTFQYIDNIVVFAESKELCDKIVADQKLGNTLALSNETNQKLYGKLPKEVSERFYSSEKLFAVSVYKNEIHESHVAINYKPATNVLQTAKPITLTFGSDVYDFWYDGNKNSCFILGETGKIAFYKNGQMSWSKELNVKPITSLTAIDLFDNGQLFYMFCTANNLYLFSESGETPTGFPVDLDNSPLVSPTFYRWKSGSYFLIPTNAGVVQLDGKGRELSLFKSQIQTQRPLVVWSSQSKLYAGITGEGSFLMYDIERQREHRRFPLGSQSTYLKFPNEVFLYELNGDSFTKVDQKGIKTKLNAQSGKILQSEHFLNRTLIIQDNKLIKLTNEHGLPYAQIALRTSDIESVDIAQSDNSKTILAVLDGLENNVYLYSTDGKTLTQKRLEGQRKVLLNAGENNVKVATIIDQFVVIYEINY